MEVAEQVKTPCCPSCVGQGVGGGDSLILKLFLFEVTATAGIVEAGPDGVFSMSSVCIPSSPSIVFDALSCSCRCSCYEGDVVDGSGDR